MNTCEVKVGQWMGHPHWECVPCGITTTDEQSWPRRCQMRSPTGRLESATGLLGPTGEALPRPQTEPGTHDEPTYVGGGWYELADGTRIQGLDNAIEEQATTHDQ